MAQAPCMLLSPRHKCSYTLSPHHKCSCTLIFVLHRIVEEKSYRTLVSLYKTLLEQDQLVTIQNSVGGGSTCYYLELCWVRLSYYCVDLLTCHTCLLYMYPNILWCTLSKVLKIKQVCQVENNVYLLTCILSQVGISSLENAKK